MIDAYTLAQIACSAVFRPRVPVDTGNMALNATMVERISPTEARIYVNSEIAPYVVYTNEPWISPHWKGKQNPNEKWFEKATEQVVNYIAGALGGAITIVGGEKE